MTLLFRKPSKWSVGPILGGLDRGGGSYTDPARIPGHVWGIPIWESTGRRYPAPNAFSHSGQSQGTVIRMAGPGGPAAAVDGTLANHIALNDSAGSLRLQKALPLTVEAIVEKFSTTGAALMQIVFTNCADPTQYAGLTVGVSAADLMIANMGDNTGATGADRRTVRGTTVLANNQIYHLIWSLDTTTTGRFYLNGHPETLGVIDGTGGAMAYDTNRGGAVGGGGHPNSLGFNGRVYMVNFLTRPIFDAEALIRARDPWRSYRDRDFRY